MLKQAHRAINKNIGKRIAQCRQKKGITQVELAKRVGLSTGWLQQIEYGNSEPSIAKIIMFAEALNVAPQELIKTEDFERGDTDA